MVKALLPWFQLLFTLNNPVWWFAVISNNISWSRCSTLKAFLKETDSIKQFALFWKRSKMTFIKAFDLFNRVVQHSEPNLTSWAEYYEKLFRNHPEPGLGLCYHCGVICLFVALAKILNFMLFRITTLAVFMQLGTGWAVKFSVVQKNRTLRFIK